MTQLKYYNDERKAFMDEFAVFLNIKEANRIISKLIKHYKLDLYNSWKFVGTESSRCISHFKPSLFHTHKLSYGKFRFSKTHTSIGVICHELAHAIETIKRGKSTHAGKHFKIMTKLIKYCNKKGYVTKPVYKIVPKEAEERMLKYIKEHCDMEKIPMREINN